MRRKRRYVPESDENHDRWLVSYADLVTLLFAFFVVMYAISQVNEGKYRVLSASLNSAFAAKDGVQLIELPTVAAPRSALQVELEQLRQARAAQKEKERRERAQRTMTELTDALSALTREGQATVTDGALGITVDLDATFLFGRGQTTLEPAARDIITAIAGVLLYTDYPLVIEGHTDNLQPAPGALSNWAISALRAAAVTQVFEEQGVIPARLTAAGLADQRPIAGNDSEEGRAKNRRVSIRIETYSNDRAALNGKPANTPVEVPDGALGSSFPRF